MAKIGTPEVYPLQGLQFAPGVELQAVGQVYAGKHASLSGEGRGARPGRHLKEVYDPGADTIFGIFKYAADYMLVAQDTGIEKVQISTGTPTVVSAAYVPAKPLRMARAGKYLYIPGCERSGYLDNVLVFDTNAETLDTLWPEISNSTSITPGTQAGNLPPGYYWVYMTVYNPDTGAESRPLYSAVVLLTGANKNITIATTGFTDGKLRLYRTLQRASELDAKNDTAFLAYEEDAADTTHVMSAVDGEIQNARVYKGLSDLDALLDYPWNRFAGDFFDVVSNAGYLWFAMNHQDGQYVVAVSLADYGAYPARLDAPPLRVLPLQTMTFAMTESGLHKIDEVADGFFATRRAVAAQIAGYRSAESAGQRIVYASAELNGRYIANEFDGYKIRRLPALDAQAGETAWGFADVVWFGPYSLFDAIDGVSEPTLYDDDIVVVGGKGYQVVDDTTLATGSSTLSLTYRIDNSSIQQFFQKVGLMVFRGDGDITVQMTVSHEGDTWSRPVSVTITAANEQRPVMLNIPEGYNRANVLYVKLEFDSPSPDYALLNGYIIYKGERNK